MSKKILYIITQSSWGGAQKYVFDLAVNLQNDFDITVACGGKGRLARELRKKGIKTVIFPMLRRPINPIKDLICFFQLYFFIKKEKFDITHTNSSKSEILGNIAARLAGVSKIIFTAHGFFFNEPMPGWKKDIFIFLERVAGRFCDKIIAVSEFDQQSAIRNRIVLDKKIAQIYNGIDLNEYNALNVPFQDSLLSFSHSSLSFSLPSLSFSRKRESIPMDSRIRENDNGRNGNDNNIIIGTIANLYSNKGLKYLIKAIPDVIEKYPTSKFIIIGDGPERKKLVNLIEKLGIEDYIDLLGKRENTIEFLKTFDIFVLPSIKEGCPYTILEAMAIGAPIIATKIGGIPEIINHHLIPPFYRNKTLPYSLIIDESGILIPPKDEKAIADAIIYLIKNPAIRKTFAKNAKERIKEFGLEKMLEKTKKEYLFLHL